MKNSFSLLIVSILMLQTVAGQDNDKPVFKKFGFRAGANFYILISPRGYLPRPHLSIQTGVQALRLVF